jgi:uncharacterized protein YjcR
MLEIENERHRAIEFLLVERYYGPRQMTYREIGDEFGVSQNTVAGWMRNMGLNPKAIAFDVMRRPELQQEMGERAVPFMTDRKEKSRQARLTLGSEDVS